MAAMGGGTSKSPSEYNLIPAFALRGIGLHVITA